MTMTEHDVRIDRPAAEVFAFLADGTNNPRWQPPVIETHPPAGPIGVGAQFHQKMRHPLGFKVSADYRVVDYQPGRQLSVQTSSGGPIRPTQRYELTANGDGSTTVHTAIEYRPQGIMQLARPLLGLLHPLFAWEASWIDNARDVLSAPTAT
jgi:uncharacterized membrane protein